MDHGEPIIDIKVEAKSAMDADRLAAALSAIAAQDRSFAAKVDPESAETIISGRSEIHLDLVVGRLQREFGLAINVGAPQVSYREAITRAVEHDYTHKKQAFGKGEFARIKFRIEPREPGAGCEFASEVIGGNVPEPFIAAVHRGVESVMASGPLIGFPVVDVKFTLTDGAYHDVDSSPAAFAIAGRSGLKEAIENAGPRILEPIMWLEVVAPELTVGDVISDINGRRGQVRGAEARGQAVSVEAMVPMAEMFGYARTLRALSRGQADCTMRFDHFEQVPLAVDPNDPDGRFPPAAAMRLRA